MKLTESILRKIVKEELNKSSTSPMNESSHYKSHRDGVPWGFPVVRTGPDGMPRRIRNKGSLIDSGKYYILLQDSRGQYELSAGPFDTNTEAYQDALGPYSYDSHDRKRLQIVRGTYDGRAEKVDADGRSYGDEIPARDIY